MDWPRGLVEMTVIKEALDRADPDHLWSYTVPRVAASGSEIARVESVLGERLDPQFRTFLQHAGGWPAFWHSVDLYGPEEYLGRGQETGWNALANLEAVALSEAGLERNRLIPIGASQVDPDLFVLGRTGSESAGRVAWFAGSLIDRWSSFEDFFDAMIDYHRYELNHLRDEGNAVASKREL